MRTGRRAVGLWLIAALQAHGGETLRRLDLETLVRSNDCLAVNLYRTVHGRRGNLVVSPFGISMNLAMAASGAAEGTLDGIRRAMGSPPDAWLPGGFARLRESISGSARTGEVDLAVANRIWVQRGTAIAPPFVETLGTFFAAGLGEVDFRTDPATAAATINEWVGRQTRARIPNMLVASNLTPDTAMILVNAVRFQGRWAGRFNPQATEPLPFRVSPERTIRVPTMWQRHRFRHARIGPLAALELPYVGRAFSLLLLLPDEPDGLAALERSLSVDTLERLALALAVGEVEVFLPRFRVESSLELAGPLSDLGMGDAFTRGRADFSRAHPSGGMYLKSFLHRAGVAIDEDGTEAWAVSAGRGEFGEADRPARPVFRADHPFLFVLTENRTGTVLFLGRVVDPAAGS